jgi:hypothetical protein
MHMPTPTMFPLQTAKAGGDKQTHGILNEKVQGGGLRQHKIKMQICNDNFWKYPCLGSVLHAKRVQLLGGTAHFTRAGSLYTR